MDFNSLRQSGAYTRQQTRPSLVQMSWCLFSDKPLSDTMMVYCQLDHEEHSSMEYHLKFKSFHSRNCLWKCHLQKWLPSCLGLNVLTWIILVTLIPGMYSHGTARELSINLGLNTNNLQQCYGSFMCGNILPVDIQVKLPLGMLPLIFVGADINN